MFQRSAKTWRVTELRTRFGKFVAEAEDGDVDNFDVNQFLRDCSDGTTTRLALNDQGALQPVPANWQQRERSSSKSARLKREAILGAEAAATKAGKSLKQAAEAMAALCREKTWDVPCERTLRNWRRRARQHESQLSPQWQRCGNRKQGPDELLLQAMEGVFEATQAETDRFTIAASWKFVEAKYDDLCTKHGQQPGRHGIRKLTAYLRQIPWKDLMCGQLDARTARALTRRTKGLNTADLFWDVVEMDATFLPIIVRDDDGKPIGRPVLYLAVDVATGYPVGLHLTILKPSVHPFLECLRYMYFPKPDGFDAKYGIKSRIEVFGKPVLLRVDNGSELVGEAAVAVVDHLFGDSARCKPMTPQEKPHVERANGSIKQYVRTLPGSTESAITKEPRIVPAQEELLTVEELWGRLLRHIYGVYVYQMNILRSWKNRKAVAPHDIWVDMSLSYFPPLPVNKAEFEMTLYFKRETRVLRHDGIAFDNFTYHSNDLGQLYDLTGSRNYEIRYADHDAEIILVLPHGGGQPVTAIAKELQGLRVDRATAKKIRDELVASGTELNRRAFQQRQAELEERQEEVAKSMRGRNQSARTKEKMNIAREAIRPTMPVSAPSSVQEKSTSNSSSGWDFDAGKKLGRTRGGK